MRPSAVEKIDLQSHSRHSDGELSVEEVVAAAAAAGVQLLALSDRRGTPGGSARVSSDLVSRSAIYP